MWLVISLILNIQLLGSLLLGCSVLWFLGSLLLGHFDLRSCRSRSNHLLLALIIQSLKKGLLSMSGG
jgi:hypothetical protein